jgi:hypothetical protein
MKQEHIDRLALSTLTSAFCLVFRFRRYVTY